MLHNNYTEINSNRARIVYPVYWKMCFQTLVSAPKGVINFIKAIHLKSMPAESVLEAEWRQFFCVLFAKYIVKNIVNES